MKRGGKLGWIAAVSWCIAVAAWGQNPVQLESTREQPIRYRRLLLPEELIPTWFPNYRPLKREAFEAEIERINERARRAAQAGARTTRATFRGRLNGGELLSGNAILEVVRTSDEPSILSLDPCNLAVQGLHWQGEDGATVTAGTTASGEFVALVDRDGSLQFDWSARQETGETQERVFELEFPHCAATRLVLELPADVRPRVDQGVIAEQSASSSTEPPAPDAGPLYKTWEIELGGHSRVRLTVTASQPVTVSQPAMGGRSRGNGLLSRENVRYRMTTSGLELRSTFQLAADRSRIEQLRLVVSPGLHVASAQVGDRVLSLARAGSQTAGEVVEVILDEPLEGADQELVVLAYTPLVLNQPWQLPRVRPEGAAWQEGHATIEVIEPLVSTGLNVRFGTETKIEPLPAPELGESRHVQFWEPEGGVEIRLGFPPQRIAANLDTAIRFSELAATARIVVDLQARQGTSFAVGGWVAPGWTIDSVQSEPSEAVESFSTQGGPRQDLQIRFRRAIPTDRTWRLIIRAHRRTPRLDQPVAANAVRVVDFPELDREQSVVSFSAEPPLRLALVGDENLQRLDPQTGSDRQPERASSNGEAIVFLDRPAQHDWTVTLSREQPRFAAQIEHVVEFDARQATESFQIRCEPHQSFVSRFLVHLSRKEVASWSWEMIDGGDNVVTAKLVSSSPDAIGGESWEINLSRPLNRPFTLRASRQSVGESELPVAFASLPEATSQSGTLRVLGVGCGPLEINVHNLEPMATAAPDPQRLPVLRGAYRYAPSQEIAAVIRRLPVEQHPAPAWLWLATYDARFDAQGEILREARLYLENVGLATLDLQLPAEATFLRAAVDHGILSGISVTDGRVSIPLPKDRRFPLISVVYRTRQTTSSLANAIQPAELGCTLPVLDRRSRLWLPPEYMTLHTPSTTGALTWDERLLGVKIWSRGEAPFDPFRAADWKRLATGFRNFAPAEEIADGSPGEHLLQDRGNWAGVLPAVGTDEAACGWQVRHFSREPLRAESLVVVRTDLLRALAAGLFLLAAGSLALLTRRYAVLGVAALMVSAVAAWSLPPEYVPAARALFLGTALGLFWNLCTRRPTRALAPPPANPTSGNSQSFVVATTTTALSLALWLWPHTLAAQLSNAPPAAEGIPTYNVLSPVDENEEPKGDYLFVPQEMYDAIYRRVNEPFGAQHAALLESAEYRAELSANDEGDSRLLVREFLADLSLRSLHRVTRYVIPWPKDRFRIVEASLNGQPQTLQWSEDGQSLLLTLESAGSHRFRLTARPLQMTAEAAGEFVAVIPRCPRARLTVEAPGALDRLQFPDAQGTVTRDEVTGETTAELGGVEELRFRWGLPVPKPMSVLDSDVAEMLWLHVQGNSLTVHGKFRFSARSGTIGQVTLEVDRRLNLLPISKDQPVATVETEAGETQLIRCWLDRPYQDVTLQLSFAMSGNGGVGRWRLPRVSAQATRRSPAWFGITVTEGMLAEISPGTVTAKIAPSQFMAAWNEDREPPQQAFASTSDVDQWQLIVRPAPPKITLEEQQEILVGSGVASVRYEAVVAAEQGRVTRLNLYIPAGFEPQDLVVLHDDANRLLRWSRASDRELTVFLTVPLSGEIHLLMNGSVPLPRGKQVRLPLIAAAQGTPGPRRVNVYQTNDVRLQILESAGLVADERGYASADWGRFVASLSGAGTNILQPSLQLSIEPNRPRVQGSLVTWMALEEDQWRAVAEVHLEVLSGTIDSVRLQLPEELAGQVQITPPVEQQEYPSPGAAGRLLVVRLPAAVDHELKLTLAADLAFAPGEEVRVPEIQVLDVLSMNRYLALPARLQQQKALWDTSGLQSAELPAEHTYQFSEQDNAVYHVVGPRVQAILREVERLTGTPQVHLADYQLRWSADRRYRGLATFYLEPSRLSEVEVSVPSSVKPLHFRVAGLPVAGRQTGDKAWRIPLGPELLPQLVEVLFEGDLYVAEEQRSLTVLAAPTISGIPTQQTLFTVQAPPTQSLGQPVLEHALTSAVEMESIRIRALESLRRSGLSDASRANTNERDVWRRDWDRRIAEVRGRERNAGNPEPVAMAEDAVPVDLGGQWRAEAAGRGPEIHCSLKGAVSQISIQYSGGTWHRFWDRFGKGVLLAGGILGVFWVGRRRVCGELWRRSPQLFVAAGGLFWWLFCSPSALGLLVLVLAAASALRPSWRTLPA